jgi:hypothetical protein
MEDNNRILQAEEDQAQQHEFNNEGYRLDGKPGLPPFKAELTAAQAERQQRARALYEKYPDLANEDEAIDTEADNARCLGLDNE